MHVYSMIALAVLYPACLDLFIFGALFTCLGRFTYACSLLAMGRRGTADLADSVLRKRKGYQTSSHSTVPVVSGKVSIAAHVHCLWLSITYKAASDPTHV